MLVTYTNLAVPEWSGTFEIIERVSDWNWHAYRIRRVGDGLELDASAARIFIEREQG